MSGDVKAIVLTLNEAEHLPECLASLRLVTDDVLVLDSGSTDATREFARTAGANVVVREFDGYANQRNAALAMADDVSWVLFLDADERLTSPGAREITGHLENPEPDVAAFWIPRRNVFFGREIRGGGWWPDYQPRLLRCGRAYFDPDHQVHEVAVVEGESRTLREPLIHLNYGSRREYIAKQRTYSLQRAQQQRRSSLIPRRRAYLSAPVRELHRRLVRLQGYRDGLTGLFLAGVLAAEEVRACYLTRRGSGAGDRG